MLALVVFGIAALAMLKTDEFPDVQAPVVVVSLLYPGASPENVEREVIEPVEDAISGISGVNRIKSSALDSFGLLIVEFALREGPPGGDAGDPRRDRRSSAPTCRPRWRSRSSRGSTPATSRSCR